MLFCAFVLPFGDFSIYIYCRMQTANPMSPFGKISPNFIIIIIIRIKLKNLNKNKLLK
jgi:hypothetical protein